MIKDMFFTVRSNIIGYFSSKFRLHPNFSASLALSTLRYLSNLYSIPNNPLYKTHDVV